MRYAALVAMHAVGLRAAAAAPAAAIRAPTPRKTRTRTRDPNRFLHEDHHLHRHRLHRQSIRMHQSPWTIPTRSQLIMMTSSDAAVALASGSMKQTGEFKIAKTQCNYY